MEYKIGDRVRYLNGKGGGTISRIKSRNEVWVMEEDGFEMPRRLKELVPDGEPGLYFKEVKPDVSGSGSSDKSINSGAGAKGSQPSSQSYSSPHSPSSSQRETPQQNPAVTAEPEYAFDEADETPEGEKISLYLAFLNGDAKDFQSSELEAQLVNDSNYYISFQWLKGKDETELLKADVVEPMTTLRLGSFSRDELNGLQYERFQGMAFKRRAFAPKPVIDISFEIKPVKFYKQHCFVDNEYFDAPALMVTLLERDVFNLTRQIDVELLQNALTEKKNADAADLDRQVRRIKKKAAAPSEDLEIDLHAGSLLDDVIGMSPKEILDYQLDKAEEVLRENSRRKGGRIVFIHGKGDGVLRARLLDLIKAKYPGCRCQDASFRKYGFGATLVIIG